MALPVTPLSLASSVQGLTLGQVSLINYVEVMGLLDPMPFLGSPYRTENIPGRIVGEIRDQKRSALDAPLYAAAGLVLRSVSYERTLLKKLGLEARAADLSSAPWSSEVLFFPAVEDEVGRLQRAVGGASREMKAWMRAMRKFNDASEYFDITKEDRLNSALAGLQTFFATSIRRARAVEKESKFRSLEGIEVYFNQAHQNI